MAGVYVGHNPLLGETVDLIKHQPIKSSITIIITAFIAFFVGVILIYIYKCGLGFFNRHKWKPSQAISAILILLLVFGFMFSVPLQMKFLHMFITSIGFDEFWIISEQFYIGILVAYLLAKADNRQRG